MVILLFLTNSTREESGMEHYTQNALDKLDRKIEEAEESLREALLLMGSGAEDGNNTWHDNPAFDQAKMEVDQATNELKRLRTIRSNAVLVQDDGETDKSIMSVGMTAIVRINDGDPITVHLAGYHVAKRDSTSEIFDLATSSPLGSALVGLSEGESNEYLLPNGKSARATIVSFV